MEYLIFAIFEDLRELVIYEFLWIVGKGKEEGRAGEGQVGRSFNEEEKRKTGQKPPSV